MNENMHYGPLVEAIQCGSEDGYANWIAQANGVTVTAAVPEHLPLAARAMAGIDGGSSMGGVQLIDPTTGRVHASALTLGGAQ